MRTRERQPLPSVCVCVAGGLAAVALLAAGHAPARADGGQRIARRPAAPTDAKRQCLRPIARAFTMPLDLDYRHPNRKSIVRVEDAANNMRHFYDALVALRQGKRKRVRVGVYGDSNHTRDFATSELREHLIARFGSGGHGWVSAGRPWGWYLHREIHHAVLKGWVSYAPTKRIAPKWDFGHSGILAIGKQAGGLLRFTSARTGAKSARTFSRLEILYRCEPRRGGRFRVVIDGKWRADVSTRCRADKLGRYVMKVPEGKHKVFLRVLQARTTVYGLSFERDKPGVVVDNLAVGAVNLRHFARSDRDSFVRTMRARDYKLIIFHTGSNMWDPHGHPRYAAKVLSRIHEALGKKVSVLFLSPHDFGKRDKKGKVRSSPRMRKCAAEKRAIARQNGVAFWDFHKDMGKLRHWCRWRMVNPDLIHVAPVFHRIMWTRLTAALLLDMRRSLAARRRWRCPEVALFR